MSISNSQTCLYVPATCLEAHLVGGSSLNFLLLQAGAVVLACGAPCFVFTTFSIQHCSPTHTGWLSVCLSVCLSLSHTASSRSNEHFCRPARLLFICAAVWLMVLFLTWLSPLQNCSQWSLCWENHSTLPQLSDCGGDSVLACLQDVPLNVLCGLCSPK